MKSHYRQFLLIVIVFTFSVILAACGSKQNANETESTTGSKDDKQYHLKVGYLKMNGAPLADIAIHEGFFEEENLEVELVPFNASTDGINALQTNKIDIGLTFGTTTPLAFIAKGADLNIIGGHMEGGHPVYVPKEDADQYKTFADFKGKTIGTVRLSVPDIIFKNALLNAGLDIEKDVKFVEFKSNANLIEAAAARKVDAAFSLSGFLTQATEAGLVPFAWSNDVQPGHVCCRVVTHGDYTEDQQIAFKKFLKGLIKAERVKLENPQIAVEASKERFNLPDEQVNEIVNEEHLINSADPHKHQVEELWKQMKGLGYIEGEAQNIDLNKHFNLKFYEEALEELIAENPDDEYYQQVLERYKQQNL